MGEGDEVQSEGLLRGDLGLEESWEGDGRVFGEFVFCGFHYFLISLRIIVIVHTLTHNQVKPVLLQQIAQILKIVCIKPEQP